MHSQQEFKPVLTATEQINGDAMNKKRMTYEEKKAIEQAKRKLPKPSPEMAALIRQQTAEKLGGAKCG